MSAETRDPPQPQGTEGASFRSGFVALLGEPNVGKSTLLNAFLEFKLSIVSPKPQTTRDKILGIYNDAASQIVFVDTPGVMEPRDRFNEHLRDRAVEALEGADVVYHMVEALAPGPLPPLVGEALARSRKPALLVVNKCDRLPGFPAQETAESPGNESAEFRPGPDFRIPAGSYAGVHYVSALSRVGLPRLLAATRALLPEGPPLYDPDQTTDRDLRFLAAEIVREKVLAHVGQEVPYAVATRTESFDERADGKHFVRVVIYVEHESQKPILIGQGGSMLRTIGAEARPEIEALADHAIFLELWVKVRKNWRKNEAALREFGYHSKPARKSKRSRA